MNVANLKYTNLARYQDESDSDSDFEFIDISSDEEEFVDFENLLDDDIDYNFFSSED